MTNFFLNIFVVGVGGFFGAILRYLSSIYIVEKYDQPVLPTLLVNMFGAFFIGFLYVLISEKGMISEIWRSLLIVGFLGALTTFSAFSLEIIDYIENGLFSYALAYIVSSVLTCVALCYLGLIFGRYIL